MFAQQPLSQAGIVAIVTSSTEVEKQEEIVKVGKQFAGQVFCAVGVHPDNVKRTNDKQMVAWVAQARAPFLPLTPPQHFALQTVAVSLRSCLLVRS